MYVNMCTLYSNIYTLLTDLFLTNRSRTLSSKKREKRSSGEASVPRVTRGPCVLVNGGSVGATSVDESATSHRKLLVWRGDGVTM